ncbi:MAG: DUF4328 domain-containing protein [Patescibacteria group bacterium]|jgi:hypothetical protein
MAIKNRKLVGILLIVLPPLVLMCTLAMYAISSFVLSQLVTSTSVQQSLLSIPEAHAAPLTDTPSEFGTPVPLRQDFAESTGLGVAQRSDEGDLPSTVGNLMKVGLGLLGIFALLGVLFGMPFGIYLIATDDSKSEHKAISVLPLHGQQTIFLFFAGTVVLLNVIGIGLSIHSYLTVQMDPLNDQWSIAAFILGGIASFSMFISCIIYLFWLGRAANNLSVHHKLKDSSGWLVWGHIIPLYSMFHPIIAWPRFWNEVVAFKHLSLDKKNRGKYAIIVFFVATVVSAILPFFHVAMNPGLSEAVLQNIALFTGLQQLMTITCGVALIAFVQSVTEALEG